VLLVPKSTPIEAAVAARDMGRLRLEERGAMSSEAARP
jgi:hypothetical protein